jgi:predicted metal-binding protein
MRIGDHEKLGRENPSGLKYNARIKSVIQRRLPVLDNKKIRMQKKDLKKYCDYALKAGATTVKPVQPSSVVTVPWVRWKCQFGCAGYDNSYCCPPHTPKPEETRKVLDAYKRALLFHIETSLTPGRGRVLKQYRHRLIDLEGEMFKDGYYKAFVFLAGPCDVCTECGRATRNACNNRRRARPSMEACGIDVFQTARNNGFHIETLSERTERRNTFCLMLVD